MFLYHIMRREMVEPHNSRVSYLGRYAVVVCDRATFVQCVVLIRHSIDLHVMYCTRWFVFLTDWAISDHGCVPERVPGTKQRKGYKLQHQKATANVKR